MIITREQWGARHPAGFGLAPIPARECWLHHSVTVAPDLVAPFDDDHAAIRAIEAIGQSRFKGGISYTWLVTPAGLVFEGHGVGRRGAHTQNHNKVGRAICLVGDHTARDLTPAQMDAVVWLLRHAHACGWLTASRLTGGHRDTKATGCPGDRAYAAIATINRRAADGTGSTTTAPNQPLPPSSLPTLRHGDRGPNVVRLQSFLRHAFPSYCGFPATGYYGDLTRAGVREFQRRDRVQGSPLDGSICGPATNAALARHGYR